MPCDPARNVDLCPTHTSPTRIARPSAERCLNLSAPTTEKNSDFCSVTRDGFTRLDADQIDEFELDDLRSYCSPSGPAATVTAQAIERMRDTGEQRDWWQEGESLRDRSK